MASIAALQKALDNNAIDVSTLNREQLMGLDKAFKTGMLKGYPNVGAMMEEGESEDFFGNAEAGNPSFSLNIGI